MQITTSLSIHSFQANPGIFKYLCYHVTLYFMGVVCLGVTPSIFKDDWPSELQKQCVRVWQPSFDICAGKSERMNNRIT